MSETDNAALAVAQVFQVADSEWSDRLIELLRDADMDSFRTKLLRSQRYGRICMPYGVGCRTAYGGRGRLSTTASDPLADRNGLHGPAERLKENGRQQS